MSLTFDLSDFRRIARSLRAFDKQIPFALAQALNKSADLARTEIIDTTWAQHVTVRNPNFLKAALTTKGTRATKKNLRVEIHDKLGRGSLLQHARGGVKRPRGAALAVPSAALNGRRTGRGVPRGLRPKALPTSGPNAAFRKGDEIFQRTGAGKNRSLKLLYTLKPSVRIAADVPFQSDFNRFMRRALPIQFRIAMSKAMQTAFRK